MIKYKSIEDSPKELTISKYWTGNYKGLLREGLPYNHEENLWNWFRRTYPDLNPEFYDVYEPQRFISPEKKLKNR